MKDNKIAVLIISALLGAGCASEENVNLERYSLVEDLAPTAYTVSYDVTVGLNGVLSEGGIVIQTSPVTLRPAKNYRWSGELSDQLKAMAIDELARQGKGANAVIEIYVSAFQGDLEGNVSIRAACKVKRHGKEILNREFGYQGRQAQDGYGALVSELKQGWKEVCVSLAAAI